MKLLTKWKSDEKSPDHILKKTANIVGIVHTLRLKSNQLLRCYFCDEKEDHIATNEPKASRLLRYFGYQKFTEMTPSGRFQLFRKIGYCIQCLFHGFCQRDFVCQHQLNEKHPFKNHNGFP